MSFDGHARATADADSRLPPACERELDDALAYYAAQERPGLVEAFLKEMERVLRVMSTKPAAGSKAQADIRTWRLRRFAATLAAIDQKEGHPHVYNRGTTRRRVRLERGAEVLAWVYVVVPERCSATRVPPRRAYLELLLTGAREHGLSPWYIDELEATATAD